MQPDAFKAHSGEVSMRGGTSPMMPQNAAFSAVPVQPGANHSVREITGRAGAARSSKSAPPQGARQIPMAGAAPDAPADAIPQPSPALGSSDRGGISIPRRPQEPSPAMGRQRPFMHREAPHAVDSYTVTLVGTAPDGQVYEVAIPYRADFPAGTELGNPEVRHVRE